MRKIARLGAVLFGIPVVTGLILGGVHKVTEEPIRITNENKRLEALTETLPGAKDFKMPRIAFDPKGIITEVNIGTDGDNLIGHNVTVTPKGYAGLIKIVVGISCDGEVKGIKILSHAETPGLGAKAPEEPFSGQFRNKKADDFKVVKVEPSADDQIQAISGATITSKAVTTGVNEALKFWRENLKDGGAF